MDVKELLQELSLENSDLKSKISGLTAAYEALSEVSQLRGNQKNEAVLQVSQLRQKLSEVEENLEKSQATAKKDLESLDLVSKRLGEVLEENKKLREEINSAEGYCSELKQESESMRGTLKLLEYSENLDFKILRKNFNLSQQELGNLVGIEQRTVSSLEKDPNYLRKMSVERAFQVLRGYNLID